jgi:hypothetical protein
MRFAAESKPFPPGPMPRAAFQQALALDDAAMEKFDRYLEALRHWQKSINLVGPNTLADPWRRHFLDSAQLLAHLPDGAKTGRYRQRRRVPRHGAGDAVGAIARHAGAAYRERSAKMRFHE